MKNLHFHLLLLLSISCFFPQSLRAQDAPSLELKKIFPYIFLTTDSLESSQKLEDLDKHFDPSWIREYLSVEIRAQKKGIYDSSISKSNLLTQEQKALLQAADLGSEIYVGISYIPQNTLMHNEPKEIKFSFRLSPKKEASYIGGQQALESYLQETIMDKIPEGGLSGYNIAALTFSIDEAGQIIDSKLFWSSEDAEIDALLFESISNMPPWQPASYQHGLKVKQDFVLMLGNMESCVVHMLNTSID
ncbi:MAG: energy transducer TonB [Bacteroidota bacterium]